MVAELRWFKTQLSHPLSNSLTVSAGALGHSWFYAVKQKWKNLVFVLVEKRHNETNKSDMYADLYQ